MEIILLESVKGVGTRGDKVKVKPGFARNFLIPNRLAIQTGGSSARVFAEAQRQREKRDGKHKREAEASAKRFEDISVQIQVEVGDEDRLFGSVTSADIAERLKEQGIEVDKRKIQLDEPLKQLGVYNVPVKLYQDVEAKVKVWVVRK